jgi:hypothetical protein
MAEGTMIQQGSFTADGKSKTLKIRSDVDKLVIENVTQWENTNNGYGFRYTWYRDMGTTALMEYHPAGDHTSAVNITSSAVTLIDSSSYSGGSWIAVTGGTDATRPVYTVASTTGLVAGNIVRLKNTEHTNLDGLDFSVDDIDNAGTNFRLANTLATAPGIAATTGHYKLVAPNIETYRMFTPKTNKIANISQAANGVVTTLVDHGYAIGQKVKIHIPSDYEMIELDGVEANITAVTDSTFTIDVDTSGYTAFAFPTYTSTPFVYAEVVPVGDAKNTAVMYNSPGKFYNQGYIGVVLTGGTTGPAGNNNDVVRWTAYKSTRLDDE